MFEYPQYGNEGEEILSFKNIWRDISPQEILGTECFMPFAPIYNEENLVTLKLTGLEYRKILSSLMLGSQFAYPQEWMQIYVNFLKGTHCPPVLVADECKEYPPYSAFIGYPLQNPYNQPDFVPSGYLIPPFVLVTDDNIGEFPQNEMGDIVVPFGAISFDANWFEDVSETLPTITINFEGTGQANIRLLNQAQGGLAIITLDNPPSLADIIAGVITGADNIIDTNLDILSLPPETATEHIFPVEVETGGSHIIYIVFFPIVDDSLIPLRFGGGFRGVELCGNLEVVDVGMTDIRLNPDTFMLEKLVLGEWETVFDWVTFFDYTQAIQAKSNDAWQFAYDLMQTTYHFSPYEDGDVGFTADSPLKLYIDAGGDPFDPSALEAAIAAAQADADAAQATANGAVTVNNTQNTAITNLNNVNIAQQVEIDDLQGRMTTAELDIDIAQADILDIAGWRALAEIALAASAQFQADMPQPFGNTFDFATDGLPANWQMIRGTEGVGGLSSELVSGNQEVRVNQIDELGYNGQGNVYMARIAVQYTGTVGETIYAGLFGSVPPDTIQNYRVTDEEFSLYVFRFIGNDYLNCGWKVRTLGDFPFIVRAITLFGWGFPNPI